MRLIDADKLIDVFESRYVDCCSKDYIDCDDCNLPGVNCRLGEMKLIIKDMPTYDIDKVVEELEEIKRIASSIGNYSGVTDKKFEILRHIDNAIEIVKEGGKNETDNT